MTDLLSIRDAVVASLKAKIRDVDIDSHGGTFDLEEVKRFATRAPAIRVAIVGSGRASRYSDGRWQIPVRFSAVICTRDTAGAAKITRDAAALILATAVELAIASNRFGLEGVFQPDDIEARSEYSGKVDQLGVALWQVTWTSGVLVGQAGEPADVAIVALTKALVENVETWTSTGGLTGADPLNSADHTP